MQAASGIGYMILEMARAKQRDCLVPRSHWSPEASRLMARVEMVQGMLEIGWAPDKPPLCRVRPCHAAKMALDDDERVPLGDCVDFVGEIATLPRRNVGATHGT